MKRTVQIMKYVFPLVMLNCLVGCQALHQQHHGPPVPGAMPRELEKVVLPTYVIEPPDTLNIEAIRIVPRGPYALQAGDIVGIQVRDAFEDAPIDGLYPIDPGGIIDLGYEYGVVKLAGLTTEQAKKAIADQLGKTVRGAVVENVRLIEFVNKQQVAGPHQVAPDGTVRLGIYGSVPVVGLTLPQAKGVLEQHLSQFLDNPEIAVDVLSYNSKVYYIILEGAGLGDTMARFPITGNETVLDALTNVNGTSQISSNHIWIARPSRTGQPQILPVDYVAITKQGVPTTNYQLLPGDRLFIAEDRRVRFDTVLGKTFAPFERLFGFSLLGVGTVSSFSGNVLGNNGFGGGGIGGVNAFGN